MNHSGNEPTAAPVADPAPTPALRVLVAEDFKVIRNIIVRMLEHLGHHVDAVVDGQAAIDAITENDYDLLLLDLSMPRMSGIDVVRWLRAHPEHAGEIAVTVVSASAREERPILNQLGVTLLLPKPFRQQQLADLIDTVVASR